jgi:hypothetical protein
MGICSVRAPLAPLFEVADNSNREISPYGSDPDLALVYPNTEPNSVDLRCGRNASISWNRPKTATVHAGDRIGFAVGEPKLPVCTPACLIFWAI